MNKSKKIRVPVYLPPELIENIDYYCERLGLSRNSFINMSIREYIAIMRYHEDPTRLIQELNLLRDELQDFKKSQEEK